MVHIDDDEVSAFPKSSIPSLSPPNVGVFLWRVRGLMVGKFHIFNTLQVRADGWLTTSRRCRKHVGNWKRRASKLREKLESVGIPTRLENQGVYVIGDLSGRCEPLDAGYRHINLIPVVAQRERKDVANELQFFIDAKKIKARYAVITSGQRIPFGGNLKDIRAKHTRKISKWASESRAHGVMVLFRSDELTFRRSAIAGLHGCHLHSNVVYYPMGRMTKAKWSEWLAWSHKKLGTHWRDCGRLKDVREVVKYVSKLSYGSQGLTKAERDGGMLGLNELTADELGWLFRETYRAKMCQPMGTFGGFKRYLTRKGERIRTVRLQSGRAVLARVTRSKTDTKKNDPGTGRVDNVVIGRMASHPRFSGLFEPCTIVKNYNPDTQTGMGLIGLEVIQSNARQAEGWMAKNRRRWRSALKVHTITPTVRQPCGTSEHEKPDNPPVSCFEEKNDVSRPDKASQDTQPEGVKVAKRPKGLTLMPSGCVSSSVDREESDSEADVVDMAVVEAYARAKGISLEYALSRNQR